MKCFLVLLGACFIFFNASAQQQPEHNFYSPADPLIRYMGRIDFSDPSKPAMWATATQFQFSFKGTNCSIVITDQVQYGTNHNYIDIIVDGKYRRIKLKEAHNEIVVATGLKNKEHKVIISKSTEAGIGYIRFEGLYCRKLIASKPLPAGRMEFYGDSITSGMGSDTSDIGCHKGEWYDETNGYYSYAAITARALNKQYNIISASGIGLIHSCCNMDIVMPQVYDKISIRENQVAWDFTKYVPDVVCICLGQNDGLQDSATYCKAYVKLIKNLRMHYPRVVFVCLSSPMADKALLEQTKKYLPAIAAATGDQRVRVFFFSKQFTGGCDSHPSLAEHKTIAAELTAYIREQQLLHP